MAATLFLAVSAVIPMLPARAQEASAMPGSRVVRAFDFEETRLGNYESVPMYWSKVVGRGYPAYSTGAFDHADKGGIARTGTTSFKLETSGGSVAYRLTPPADKRILIQADSDYYVLAFVKTAKLAHARADVTAWFADEAGNILPATEMHSQAYTIGGEADDAWRVLYIYVPGPGIREGAGKPRSLVLQLGLMQPQQLGVSDDAGLGKFAIYQQDIEGAVWFDDLTVFQLPRVGVSVPAEVTGGIFSPRQDVELDVVVSDMAGREDAAVKEPLDARLKIADAEGLMFAAEHWNAAATPEHAWTHRFSHAAFPAGLYTATLEVADGKGAQGKDVIIARRQTSFLCLPSGEMKIAPAPEFGIGVAGRKSGAADDMALWTALVQQSGAGLIQLPVWRRDMSEEALSRRDPALDGMLNALQRMGIWTIGAFPQLPAVVAKRLPVKTDTDAGSLLGLLSAEGGGAEVWKPYFSFALTRYANRMDQWEIGDPGAGGAGGGAFFGESGKGVGAAKESEYARLYGMMASEMASLLNRPRVLIPWNALLDFDAKQYPRAALDLRLPAVIKPGQLPAYIENFRQQSPVIFAHLDAPAAGAGGLSHVDRLADFAQRIVFARTANPQGILYDAAVTPANAGASASAADEMLLVYRAMIRALGNSAYVSELPVARGVRAFLFQRGNAATGGTLVMWAEAAGSEVALDLPIGRGARAMDIVGTERMVMADAASGLTHVVLTTTPIILDQLDARPLQLQTSFALATQMLPAGVGSLKTDVILKNPYAEGITGTLRMQAPKGWSVEPSAIRVVLAGGAELRQPVTVRYPFSESAGPKEIGARLVLDASAGAKEQEISLSYRVAVTSDRVEMEAFAQMLANGDVVVQQVVTNISGATIDAQAYAMLPNYPRQQRYVVGLLPGQTVIKRFTFAAGTFVSEGGVARREVSAEEIAKALAGKTATLGLRQTDGTVLLTKTVGLE